MAARPPQEEEDASELKLGDDFTKAKCLMNAEVAIILRKKLETLQDSNPTEDPHAQVTPVFEKALAYVERFSRHKNDEAVKQVREKLASEKNLSEFETCVIGNLGPDTLEEAKALVPSLVTVTRNPPIDDDQIEALLHELAVIRKFE
eukprot:jgi/Mesen1/7827/ME000417S07133